MPQLLTDLVELGVGIACLGAAAMAWRRGLRVIAAVLGVAGLAAAAHALWSMVSG